jgi:hypothetical protein
MIGSIMERTIQPPIFKHFWVAIYLLLGMIAPFSSANALITTENTLRIEANSGNLILGSEKAEIERGEVFRSVILLWGNLEIRGQVKDVLVVSGKVTIHEGAVVQEKVVIMGGEFVANSGANIQSDQILYRTPGPIWNILQSILRAWVDNLSSILKWVALISLNLFYWVLGYFLFAYSSTLRGIASARIFSQWAPNLFAGILSSFLVPIFCGLFIVSIIGILFLPFFLLFLAITFVIAYWGAALFVGHRLLPAKGNQSINLWGFALGLAIFQTIWILDIWWGNLGMLFLCFLAWGSLARGFKLLWK